MLYQYGARHFYLSQLIITLFAGLGLFHFVDRLRIDLIFSLR
jgi:hypothetical protein